MKKRVVITGMGAVTPIGNNVADFWANIKAGKCGVGPLTRVDSDPFPSKIAAEVKDFDPNEVFGKKEAKRMDLYVAYALQAAIEAYENANLSESVVAPEKIGCILGNGVGGITTFESNVAKQLSKGVMTVEPLLIPKMIGNIGPGMIAIRYNAQGPCYTVVTACSSATDAIGAAAGWIRDGVVDVMITGGAEAPICNTGIAGFSVLKALSTSYNETPQKASRPFDKDRDGFVIGEGAGILILEELEHALKRGATIYAEIAGYGCTCDANHLTAPHPEGRGAIAAMKMAVASAGLKLTDIDYINAHGTSTPINDPTETMAIKGTFGDHAYKLKVSSTKSMTGHLLGGAGGVEAIISALALKEQFYPATINFNEADEQCDLDYIPNKGYNGEMKAALSNSLGFGGHNGILCLKKYE